MLAFLRSTLAVLAFWLIGACVHAEVRVVIVSSDSTTAYADAAQALMVGLTQYGMVRSDIRQMSVAEWASDSAQLPAFNPQAFVAMGTEAALTLARARLKAPVLNALIPRSSFERVLRESGRSASAQFNALYLDQPLPRQIALIRLALPKVKRVGVLLGPDSATRSAALRSAASASGLFLKEGRLDDNTSVFGALQTVLDGSDVLLALADPMVFNSNSIQNILLTTIRSRVPLVAFSPAYVRAGALLAMYSTPAQAGAQAAQWALGVLANRVLPDLPLEPADFEISVNEQVSKLLNLPMDVKALTTALKRQESQP